ncbi:MAG: 6-phosphogluconate dehydrogenase NAD-binding protein [Frankiales bacterium]|jgi:3-hydroxyisobutyrate dehydrogenase-like beta-hydroxyacid dehydrogenase|nr:6-phosphogluconate dehydrogenase NAD-binding protein [Frankiales bacterium]
MRVSVLGLGNMGRSFATRALDRGHEVRVWNRSPGRAGELVAKGGVEAKTVREAVAPADVTLVIVADDAAVESVCLGVDGAVAALAPDGVLAQVSTVRPRTVRRVAEAGAEGRVLDAPVMGSPAAVSRGEARFLLGGDAGTVSQLDPLWSDLGAGYVHCGPVGNGSAVKLVSNLQLVAGVTAMAEGICIARAHGVDDDTLRKAFSDSFVVSPATRLRLDSLLDEAHPGWFPPHLARKDVRLAIELAKEGDVPARVAPANDDLLTKVIDSGRQWPDFSAVIEAYRQA